MALVSTNVGHDLFVPLISYSQNSNVQIFDAMFMLGSKN
jgi:hypothetical protein